MRIGEKREKCLFYSKNGLPLQCRLCRPMPSYAVLCRLKNVKSICFITKMGCRLSAAPCRPMPTYADLCRFRTRFNKDPYRICIFL